MDEIKFVGTWCLKNKEMLCKNWDGKGWAPTANDIICPESDPCPYLVKPKEVK